MGSPPMEKGKYIVIEGPIGVGKTSLVNLLAKRFSAKIPGYNDSLFIKKEICRYGIYTI